MSEHLDEVAEHLRERERRFRKRADAALDSIKPDTTDHWRGLLQGVSEASRNAADGFACCAALLDRPAPTDPDLIPDPKLTREEAEGLLARVDYLGAPPTAEISELAIYKLRVALRESNAETPEADA